MAVTASTPIELVEGVYARFEERIDAARERHGRSLTLAEKILIAHLDDPTAAFERGVTYNDLRPDRLNLLEGGNGAKQDRSEDHRSEASLLSRARLTRGKRNRLAILRRCRNRRLEATGRELP